LLGKAGEGKVIVLEPGRPRPIVMTQAELERVWDGRLPADDEAGCPERPVASIRHHLVSRRSPQVSTALGEVLVASLFLQLFALVSPLFFQVVIDKVLVHRSMSTLTCS